MVSSVVSAVQGIGQSSRFVTRAVMPTPRNSRRARFESRAVAVKSRLPLNCIASASTPDTLTATPERSVETQFWTWRGYQVRYQRSNVGVKGPSMVLIHGFGGNCDHWRKNIPALAEVGPVFAIDLLGFGFSEKPDPRSLPPGSIYNFENWGKQVADFCVEIVGGPAFLITNSVGGIAGLQAAVTAPELVRGVVLLDISLRGLHIRKQPPPLRPFVKALQTVLRETPLGLAFFGQVAQPLAVRNVLREAYHDPATVTDELVQAILQPGLQPGAAQVFLDFISYSGGPLPEDLLPLVDPATCPVLIAWGEKDPWEPMNEGRKLYAGYPCIEDFIVLPETGHCPMDERPDLVNPILIDFVRRNSSAL